MDHKYCNPTFDVWVVFDIILRTCVKHVQKIHTCNLKAKFLDEIGLFVNTINDLLFAVLGTLNGFVVYYIILDLYILYFILYCRFYVYVYVYQYVWDYW